MNPACRVVVGLLAFSAVLFSTSRFTAAEPAATAGKANYGPPFETVARPALIPLPPGAVEPQGWLRDWCLTARDGYTGHMDEVDDEFKRAWAANHTMTGNRLNWPAGAWPYEGGGYWFDGLARLGYALHDDALLQQVKKRLDVVVDHSNDNGILFLWWLNRNNPEDQKSITCDGGWPIWASGLFGRAMAAYYAGSGDERVLKTLERAYSGDRAWTRLAGGVSNTWAAYQTYTWTGNKEIAETLNSLFAESGEGNSANPVSQSRYRRPPNEKPGAEKNDHGVFFNETTIPWALGYLWTGNPEFLEATRRWYEFVERDSMQPYGVIVADEYYGPAGPFRGTETCDVAAYLWSQILLLSISGDGRLADKAERAFFNAGPATVARDYKTHVYFQTPNRLVDKFPPLPHGPGAGGCSYQLKHSPLCCTAALNRILPNYVMHLWMATYDNGLVATHYGPSKTLALVADHVPVELVSRTEYPFNDAVEINVSPAREAEFPLSFRIPGWCAKAEVSVNGVAMSATPDAKGFVRFQRLWKPGDTVRLRFPMAVDVATGRDQNAEGAPYASVSYGPLLFALPIADTKDANTPDAAAKWTYAIQTQGEKLGADMTVQRNPMPAKWDWPLESPLKIRANAVSFDWKPDAKQPLPSEPITGGGTAETITLVPYGCTKFRVSMFPMTQRTFERSELKKTVSPEGK